MRIVHLTTNDTALYTPVLTELFIKNFTIIEQSHVELNQGMAVLTGETGAGKSILIDALGLALGNRADTSWIRHDCEQAEIIATFITSKDSRAYQWCKNHDIDQQDNEPLILRRTLNQNGRTKAQINGRPVTVQQLKQLGQTLVHIHSQNEHHALLSNSTQLNRLDHYAKHLDLVHNVKTAYINWKTAKQNHQATLDNQSTSAAEKELLSYQVNELNEFDLGKSEANDLIQTHQQLAHAQDLLTATGSSLNSLNDNPDQSVLSELNHICQTLEAQVQFDPKLQDILNMLNEAKINLEEATSELSNYHNQINHDPETLNQLEFRLNIINTLAHKHHVQPEDLYQTHQGLIDKLNALSTDEENLEILQQAITAAESKYHQAAKKLTKNRLQAAKKLGPAITQTMQKLGMEGGVFEIELTPNTDHAISATGAEICQFNVSTNPGQPVKSMQSVVSGGELSRISLAIQVLTAAQSPTPTLIFDEVDVGIGGGTAEIVGQLLRQLGEHCQVLCVTHLPQVAARGHHHIQIHKIKTETQTQTGLTILDEKARIQEIARMLGGVKIQKETIQHAKAMLS